jgi:hypothetical protein
MDDVSAVVLTLLNLVFWVGILFNLPGTWLMVLVTAVLTWWPPGQPSSRHPGSSVLMVTRAWRQRSCRIREDHGP